MNSSDQIDRQWQEWDDLFQKISATLANWGTEDAFGRGDYLIVDDNYGPNQHSIEVHRLRLLQVPLIKGLQALLAKYPAWEIILGIDIPGKPHWPPMGITIRKHEIIDGLRRDVLPPEFKNFKIPGSRPDAGYD